MQIIDRYAYGNRIRHIHPGYKFAVAGLTILLLLLLDSPPVSLLAIGVDGRD
ncbi:MAG: hypothetical protein HC802_19120 [Caldilineaceae bacterium]|nr:hypothetical protein [Caldilineaceae bacterium]